MAIDLRSAVSRAIKQAADAPVTTPAPAEAQEGAKSGMPLQGGLLKLVNDQYGGEVLNAESYYAVSAYFYDLKLEGFAKFFRKAAEEERIHAMKFFDFLVKCNVLIQPVPIKAPRSNFATPLEAVTFYLTNEQQGTRDIQRIADTAIANRDWYTFGFIQWFLDEQLEECRKAEDIAKKVAMVQDDRAGLLVLDEQIGE